MIRVDLHVHSKYSTRPSQWFLQKLGCPESFTEPLMLYQVAKQKGMSLVTITDHNVIGGALEIAHLPDAFISEEITTYFPADRCKVHVIALNITEKHHDDFQQVRQNIFELTAYLQQEHIPHILAHPFYSLNERLSLIHFEQLLLLFKNFELNGARNDRENQHLQQILAQLTPEAIARLADKHNIAPAFAEPWRKHITGGSDDHSGLNIGRTYTEIPIGTGLAGFLEGLHQGRTQVVSHPSTPLTMAHNFYGIAYQFYRNKFNLEQHVNKDPLLRFLDRSLRPEVQANDLDSGIFAKLYLLWNQRKIAKFKSDIPETLLELLRLETQKLIQDKSFFNTAPQQQDAEQAWFEFVNQLSNGVMLHFAHYVLEQLSKAHVFNFFNTLGSAAGLYTLLAPYFIAFSLFSKDKRFTHRVRTCFDNSLLTKPAAEEAQITVAHFTDTFYDINGVALTLQQQVQVALKHNKNYLIMTCHPQAQDEQQGVCNFKPIGIHELPDYPEQKIAYPPFLELLQYCYEHNITHIHSATPGPMGLAALAIAHILDLPISATYHTDFPSYARYLIEDKAMEEWTWKYILWYYAQMEFIYVPSQSTGQELIQKGIPAEKIKGFPRGINIHQFNPNKKNGIFTSHYPIREQHKLLYVGRVSKEKNLPLLVDAFRTLIQSGVDSHLIIVGEGPYRQEMQQAMADLPCTFTGYLSGEELATLYASSDLFVFPSTTDTFGNVVLEAQASGIPVIVTDQGGPQEGIVPGKTGIVVKGGSAESLLTAMQTLITAPEQRQAMGQAARCHMEAHSFENAFMQTWHMYQQPQSPNESL